MGPFAGLQVLDLSTNRVGAQVSQLLADFGADVTWVEPPGGAELREQPAFPFWARGKRSIVLDLRDESDRDRVRALAGRADVLVDTFRPGVLDRLGLGYEALAAANPRLVAASVTGFGRRGPYADVPGYEGVVLAKMGVFSAFDRLSTGSAPPFVSAPFASFSASQTALHGILAALYERERSGLGQRVDTSLVKGFMMLDTWSWFEHLIAQRWPDAYVKTPMFDPEGRPASPFPFFLMVALTRDGEWLQFASVAPHLFAGLMGSLGLDGMFSDPEWKGLPLLEDPDKRLELWTRMLEAARRRSLEEWQAVFEADPNVFAEVFRRGPGVLDHPQLVHDGLVVEVVDAERGPVRQPGPLVSASKTPAELGSSAPLLDEHRDAILAVLDSDAPSVASAVGDEPRDLPLAGVTILELAVLFAAPHGPTMLSDLGARVIKVEPLEGDPIRTIIPFPESGGAKVMQGKESICVDLTTPEGLAIVQDLARQADVVVQGFRAGAARRLQLDYEAVRALNPDVVYVNAPGYGVDGPYGGRPAYAPSIGATVGMALANVGASVPEGADLDIDQVRDGARRLSAGTGMANAQADGFAGLGVATGILVGLVARARGGGGQELFTSMVNTGAHAMSASVIDYPGAPAACEADVELRGYHALYRVYDAAEGWVFLAAPGDSAWDRLAKALAGRVELATDARFADPTSRQAHDAELTSVLAEVFATRTDREWEADLLGAGVGCVAVTTDPIEAFMLEVGDESGYLAPVTHPIFDDHLRLAPTVELSRSATRALPGVLAGSHTDVVLAELGRSEDDVADLRQRSVIA